MSLKLLKIQQKKHLRSDIIADNKPNSLNKYLSQREILQKCTESYTPQKNGITKSLDRNPLKKTKSVLEDTGVSHNFLAGSISTALHIQNILPSTAFQRKALSDKSDGKPPHISHLCFLAYHTKGVI